MLTIEYKFHNGEELLEFFSEKYKFKRIGNKLMFPDNIGKGFLKIITLPNGLNCFISSYTSNADILFKREKISQDLFLLRLDEISLKNDNEINKSAVLLSSVKHDWIFFVTENTEIKAINIFFSIEWLEKQFGVEKIGELLLNYLTLKKELFNYEPFDIEYKKLLIDIIEAENHSPFEILIIQNRMMLVLERFFSRIYSKMNDSTLSFKLSTEDISSIVQLESILVSDFSDEMPGITVLAKKAAMSPTKLKTSFKEVYGMPIYQYYQKHRMNKAKAMLLTNKYSVKEVGMGIGFTNLSNFAKAFKKVFGQLPSDVLK